MSRENHGAQFPMRRVCYFNCCRGKRILQEYQNFLARKVGQRKRQKNLAVFLPSPLRIHFRVNLPHDNIQSTRERTTRRVS